MNIETTRKMWDKWGKVFMIGVAALIVSPVIFVVVKGLIGLAVAAFVGLIIVTFAPIVSMKFANWKVRGIVAEARENPIETLQNLLIAKKAAFQTFHKSVNDAVTAVKDFEVKCRQFSAQYPARAEEFQNQLAAMNNLVERKKAALRDAKLAIEQGEDKLQECKAYYDMAIAAQKANKAANLDTGDIYESLKADTAVESVLNNMSRAFAEIEVADALESPTSPMAIADDRRSSDFSTAFQTTNTVGVKR